MYLDLVFKQCNLERKQLLQNFHSHPIAYRNLHRSWGKGLTLQR